MKRVLIFANGDPLDGDMVRRAIAAAESPHVIAADGGVHNAQLFGLEVDSIVGDMDSLSADELRAQQESGAEINRFPAEKDFTDLELALKYACKNGAEWIRIVGGVGGRLDQTLANVYLLALPELAGCNVSLVAGNQETRLLKPGEHQINGADGDTISLIPLGGAVHGIHTANLYYPLTDETLEFGPARGISNVMTGEMASVRFVDGTLLLIHTVGRA
jgi:thiamine pyrophosphokinase